MAPILPFEITPLEGYNEWKRTHSQRNATSHQHKTKPEKEPMQGYILCAIFGTVFVVMIIVGIIRIILHRAGGGGGGRRQRVGERAIPLSDDASALSDADTVISIQPYGDQDIPDSSTDESASERDHGARGVAVAHPRRAVLRGMRPANDGWSTPPPPYSRAPSYISRASSSVYSEHPPEAAGQQMPVPEQASRVEGAQSEASSHSVYSEHPSEASERLAEASEQPLPAPEQPTQVEGVESEEHDPNAIVTSETAATNS
ncbi:hypothetical protein VPNG_07264 [Cytospora leucostoma]|uniref:Transmembrane protein n=1 Tax=Cytospora leucostoma TaxID=1230097 RepID=A0A423WK73_9PEZI|nr:hypothetical protein VPNG_07264 [Cytospora leucostoma]